MQNRAADSRSGAAVTPRKIAQVRIARELQQGLLPLGTGTEMEAQH